MRQLPIFLAALIAAICLACSGPDRRLAHAADIVDTIPRQALEILDTVDPSSLSTSDRHLRNLLIVKARDKAYLRHISDSLILDALDYYNNHGSKQLRAEALYYAGRVYSDLGDFPTALGYFQDALELLPDNKENLNLRGNVASQTGRLLNTLRLYSEAIPYVEESLRISRIEGDPYNIAYDAQLLGTIHMHLNDLDKAEKLFTDACVAGAILPDEDKLRLKTYLAAASSY